MAAAVEHAAEVVSFRGGRVIAVAGLLHVSDGDPFLNPAEVEVFQEFDLLLVIQPADYGLAVVDCGDEVHELILVGNAADGSVGIDDALVAELAHGNHQGGHSTGELHLAGAGEGIRAFILVVGLESEGDHGGLAAADAHHGVDADPFRSHGDPVGSIRSHYQGLGAGIVGSHLRDGRNVRGDGVGLGFRLLIAGNRRHCPCQEHDKTFLHCFHMLH